MSEAPVRLRCTNLHTYHQSVKGSAVHALKGIDLEVREGEFVCLVGSSGSGKSTLLRVLAGLLPPDKGKVELHPEPERPGIGFLFQNDSIFPWLTVERNLGYSLEARGVPVAERRERVRELCRMIGLAPDAYLHKYPRELSGGEARRVGLGMALSSGAAILLLDEPTSQVDYLSRLELQELMLKVWREGRTTVLCVTHDIDEAIRLGERIFVLGHGKLLDTIVVNLPISPTPEPVLLRTEAVRSRIIERLRESPE